MTQSRKDFKRTPPGMALENILHIPLCTVLGISYTLTF
jgi:hypothetical protein